MTGNSLEVDTINDCRVALICFKKDFRAAFVNPRHGQVHMQGSITLCCCFLRLDGCVYCREIIIPTVIRCVCSQKAAVDSLHFHMAHAAAKLVLIQPEAQTELRQVQATQLGLISNLSQYGRRFGQRPAGLYNTSTNMLRETDKSLLFDVNRNYAGLDSCLCLSLSLCPYVRPLKLEPRE